MVSLTNLRKEYHGRLVLSIDHLQIGSGIHWVRGANGSGKSTLLKTIAGIIPFQGEVACEGINLKKNPVAYKKMISYAEAEPLYPEFLTGLDLIRFYESVRKSDRKHSEELMQHFGVDGYYKKPSGTYSSGMTKKLSLILAFMGDTKLLLLDEPFVTLDAASVKALARSMDEWIGEGKNLMFTSHQTPELQSIAITSQLLVENQTVCFQS